MGVRFHPRFQKQLERLSVKLQVAVEVRLELFRHDPFNRILNNHALTGRWRGYRSVNITGDVRVVYEPIGKDKASFVTIGTHSQLYGK